MIDYFIYTLCYDLDVWGYLDLGSCLARLIIAVVHNYLIGAYIILSL